MKTRSELSGYTPLHTLRIYGNPPRSSKTRMLFVCIGKKRNRKTGEVEACKKELHRPDAMASQARYGAYFCHNCIPQARVDHDATTAGERFLERMRKRAEAVLRGPL